MSARRIRAIAGAVALLAGCSSAAGESVACGARREKARDAQWSMDLPSAPGAVAVDAQGAVVTLDGRSVRAVDREGRTAWEVALAGAGLDWPVIDGDLVLVPTNGDAGGRCVALDRSSGREVWHTDTGPGEIAAVAMRGDVAVCASAAGTVVARERATGAPRWSVDLRALVHGRAVTLSPRGALALDATAGVVALVIGIEGAWRVASFDLGTGAPGMAVDLGVGPPPSAVASDDAGALVVGDGRSPAVFVVDLVAGTLRGGVPTGDAFDPSSIPLVADGTAVVIDRGGGLTAVDLATGSLRWRADLGAPVLDTRPVLAGATLVLTDWVRELHAFRWADGRPVAAPLATPSVVAVGADPDGAFLVAAGRGAPGNRLDGLVPTTEPSGPGRDRPLQCPSEPGQSSGQPARP